MKRIGVKFEGMSSIADGWKWKADYLGNMRFSTKKIESLQAKIERLGLIYKVSLPKSLKIR